MLSRVVQALITLPRRRTWAVCSLILLLSFAPPQLKHLLHTRGSLHGWAHAALFASLYASWLWEGTGRQRALLIGSGLLFFAVVTEWAQMHGIWANLEWGDVLCDVSGVTGSALLLWLRQCAWKRGVWLFGFPLSQEWQAADQSAGLV